MGDARASELFLSKAEPYLWSECRNSNNNTSLHLLKVRGDKRRGRKVDSEKELENLLNGTVTVFSAHLAAY